MRYLCKYLIFGVFYFNLGMYCFLKGRERKKMIDGWKIDVEIDFLVLRLIWFYFRL